MFETERSSFFASLSMAAKIAGSSFAVTGTLLVEISCCSSIGMIESY